MAAGNSPLPRVSVVIPAYQAASYISATIYSAQAQTLADIEILVVDDGSTDDTPEIVARIAASDDRIRLLTQENRGVAAARNHGIEAARSPYIAPLDADDIWRPEKLELQLRAIESKGSEYVLAYSWFAPIDLEDRIVGPLDFRPVAADNALAEFTMQSVVGASSPLMRRSVLQAVGGYDASLRERGGQGSEDWKLHVEMAAAGKVTVVPRFLMGYRRVPASMSRDLRAALESHLLAVADIRTEHPDLPSDLFLWSELHYATFMARTYFRERSYISSVRMMSWAAQRAIRQDVFFLFRPALRSFLAMRAARVSDARDPAYEGTQGLAFLTADLSRIEAMSSTRLQEARARFVAAVARADPPGKR